MQDRTAATPIRAARALAALCAVAALASGLPAASAAPPKAADGPVYSVRVDNAAPSVPLKGKAAFTVVSRVETGSPYVEVRVRVLRPSGKLFYQRTRVFNDVESSTVPAQFDRDLTEGDLRAGRYPVEVRVRARGTTGKVNEVVTQGRILVYDPVAPRVPLAVVVRVAGAPALDPDGRFVEDPAVTNGPLDAAQDLVALAGSRSTVRLSAGIPPMLVEQWERASRGYAVADAAGVREFSAETATARRHAAALESLTRALSTGRLELLDVPFADPDAAGLAAIGGTADLARHLSLGRSVCRAALVATPAPGVLPAGQALTVDAIGALASQDVSYAVLAPASLGKGAAGSGAWRVAESTLTALVADPALGALAASKTATPGAALDRAFDLRAAAPTAPIAAVIDLGPGLPGDTAALDRFLSDAESSGWIRLVSASEAARTAARGSVSLATEPPADRAPTGYREETAAARRSTLGLAAAVGPADADADATLRKLMLAESSRWAGADGKWGIADRGRAFAASAQRSAQGLLSKVALNTQDITLSGNSGTVPVVVANGTGKPLALRLVATSDSLALEQRETTLAAKAGENYATIPVDLRGAISAEMTVALLAGDLVVAQDRVTVRATLLDRLVIIAAVVLVLLGLLVVVYRKRASTADGGVSDPDDAGRIGAGTPTARGRRRTAGGG